MVKRAAWLQNCAQTALPPTSHSSTDRDTFSRCQSRLGRIRSARVLLFLLCCAWVGMMLTVAPVVAMSKDRLTIVTASGTHKFNIEVADTDEDKARGLMFRTKLGRRAGMLFPHDSPTEITMWMRNTYISLDMIFINADGTVHRVARQTEPFSEAIIASNGKVLAVLEVAAGVAAEIGLKPGDRVVHKRFGNHRR